MLDHSFAELSQTEQPDEIVEDLSLLRTVQALQVGEQRQTLVDHQELGQIRELRTIAEVLARTRVVLVGVVAIYVDRATRRLELAH